MTDVFFLKKLTLFLLVCAISLSACSRSNSDEYLFTQTFESLPTEQNWFSDKLRIIDSKDDKHGHIVQHTYVPSESGTPYVGHRFKFNQKVTEATLSFDMKLDTQFEFVKGGKMHGLGGGKVTTGCREIDPDGWSVRMMWRKSGQPVLYIYHQDRKNRCGDNVADTTGFTFSKDVWYTVDLQVKLNSALGSKDGLATLYIDGIKRAERNGLNLTGNMKMQIDSFLYNSFYGGNDPSWSPSVATYAYYDNFIVRAGLNVSKIKEK